MRTFREKITAFSQGNLRKFLLKYKPLRRFVPTHIKEQIVWRQMLQDPVCIRNGACKLCGCAVPGLEMANAACEKPCYPAMLGQFDWTLTKFEGFYKTKMAGRQKVFIYDKKLMNGIKKL